MIALIRASQIRLWREKGLITQFGLSQIQAQAILDMQLQRLTGLERDKILNELAELPKLIERLLAILSSDKLVMQIVVDELRQVQEKYGDARRTEILAAEGEFRIEDLIAEEDMAITVSNTGYIKRTAITNYRNQRRGGKGRIGMRTREEDFVSHLFVASSHAYIMIFSDRGRAYWLKVHEIPDVGPDGRGKAIANLVSMEEGERIAALLAVKEFEDDKFIVMGTRRGVIKKTELVRSAILERAASSPWASRKAMRSSPCRSRTATARSSSGREAGCRSGSPRATSGRWVGRPTASVASPFERTTKSSAWTCWRPVERSFQ